MTHACIQRRIQTFEKGGTTGLIIIIDVGLAGICTVIVCEVHGHVNHANTRRSRGMLTQETWKITLSKIEFENNFRVLSPFNALWTQVYKMSQNVVIILYPSSYSAIVYLNICATIPAIAINVIVNAILWFNIGWQCSRYTCKLIKCIVLIEVESRLSHWPTEQSGCDPHITACDPYVEVFLLKIM